MPQKEQKGFSPTPDGRRRDGDGGGRFWQDADVERALAPYEITVCMAHVRMLAETGIVNQLLAEQAVQGLELIKRELLHDGKPYLEQLDPDIHQALFRRLKELVAEDAANVIQIAKSPNDQIATDIRLWLRDMTAGLFETVLDVRKVLLTLAERDMEVIMPGYTHMQPAMPILLSHWWLSNEARFHRDFERLTQLYHRINLLPLGAGMNAGTSQPIDRHLVAKYLGFAGVIDNSLDAITDRDYLVELANFAALTGVHVSQIGSELLLWATQEFGFVRLPRAFTFKSHSMPSKRNPEVLEILRARASLFSGRLMQFLTDLKGIPVSYTQDLQELLPSVLEIVDNLTFVLDLLKVVLPAISFDAERMLNAARADLSNFGNAVDFLVERGLPHEKAKQIVESLVEYTKQRRKQLNDLAMSEWTQFSPAFTDEIYSYLTVEESVESHSSFGGTAQEQVDQSLRRARDKLLEDLENLPLTVAERLNARGGLS